MEEERAGPNGKLNDVNGRAKGPYIKKRERGGLDYAWETGHGRVFSAGYVSILWPYGARPRRINS